MERGRTAHCFILLLASIMVEGEPTRAKLDGLSRRDCGFVALCVLMQIHGHDAGPKRVSDALGSSKSADGLSLAELRDAGRWVGFRLRGERISISSEGDWPFDQPAIVHGHGQGRNHFFVVRPIGSNGRRVQIIDPPHEPVVVDSVVARELLGPSRLALIHDSAWPPSAWMIGAGMVLFVSGLALLTIRVSRHSRSGRRPVAPSNPS